MRILILALLLSTFSYGQEMSIVHFNYEWNSGRTYKGLDRLKGIKVQYAYVEQQSDAIRKSIKSVPTIVIYKDGKPIEVIEGGLKMKIDLTIDELKALIDKHKKRKQT